MIPDDAHIEKDTITVRLLKKVFDWSFEIRPDQPVSVGVWNKSLINLNKFQMANSDIITYHNYDGPVSHVGAIDSLETYGRPMICTEYMARRNNSLFKNIMPILCLLNTVSISFLVLDATRFFNRTLVSILKFEFII